MKTAEIKELFIVNGKELQKLIDKLNLIPKPSNGDTRLLLTGLKGDLEELQQSLSPLEPVLEKAWDGGFMEGSYKKGDSMHQIFQDFLNKPIELK